MAEEAKLTINLEGGASEPPTQAAHALPTDLGSASEATSIGEVLKEVFGAVKSSYPSLPPVDKPAKQGPTADPQGSSKPNVPQPSPPEKKATDAVDSQQQAPSQSWWAAFWDQGIRRLADGIMELAKKAVPPPAKEKQESKTKETVKQVIEHVPNEVAKDQIKKGTPLEPEQMPAKEALPVLKSATSLEDKGRSKPVLPITEEDVHEDEQRHGGKVRPRKPKGDESEGMQLVGEEESSVVRVPKGKATPAKSPVTAKRILDPESTTPAPQITAKPAKTSLLGEAVSGGKGFLQASAKQIIPSVTGSAVTAMTGSPTIGSAAGTMAGAATSALPVAATAALGSLAVAVIAAVEAFKSLKSVMNSASDAVANYSGQVSAAKGMREVAHVQSMLDRDRVAGKELARWEGAETKMDTAYSKMETALVKFFGPFMSTVEEGLADVVDVAADWISGAKDWFQDANRFFGEVRDFFAWWGLVEKKKESDKQAEKAKDPTMDDMFASMDQVLARLQRPEFNRPEARRGMPGKRS